jgi:predicted nuclease with RNAse H fold
MSHRDSGSIVVGIDVGGPKKGFHAVAFQDGQYREKLSTLIAEESADWCRRLKASVIGIDAPCRWSLTGRARPCERALAAEGLHTFATPSQTKGEAHPFYRWMVKGTDLYRCLEPSYPLFNGQWQPSSPVCFETFPHAVACALARKTLSAKQKRADRSRLLREAGVSIDSLTNIDQVDAAICALAAHHLLAGTFKAYGDAAEGIIVVPKPLC